MQPFPQRLHCSLSDTANRAWSSATRYTPQPPCFLLHKASELLPGSQSPPPSPFAPPAYDNPIACVCAQLVSSGADGLLKLWHARSSECTATFDTHEGKVWALDSFGSEDSWLASGAADGSLVVWRDATAEKKAERAAEAVAGAEGRQALANALQVCVFGGEGGKRERGQGVW